MTENYYKIFDRMIEGVQVIDSEWRYVYVNDTVVAQGKSSREKLLGRTMMEEYPGIEKSEMFAHLEKCMKDGEPHQMINEFNFSDGSKGYFELRMQPVDEGVLIMSFDVTAQKRAEHLLQDENVLLDEKVKSRTAELEMKNKELEQFAYIASHDLQEPLRTVLNYIQVFEEDYGSSLDVTAAGHLNAMKRATKRMNALTKALLDFSRLGRGKKLTPVSIAAVVGDVLSDLDSSIKSSGAKITVTDMPQIKAYETEIRQVFQNLVSNAIKFGPKNKAPEIKIASEKKGDHWQFTVSDNGIGIDPAYHDRIFNIFQRLHKSDEYEGNGIGLANCKKIIDLHRGQISVDSAPGKGSTFRFTIATL